MINFAASSDHSIVLLYLFHVEKSTQINYYINMNAYRIEILSVSELTQEIKTQLSNSFSFVKVKGEVSNLKKQTSGHIYFSLKDSASQVSAVLFQGYARSLTKELNDGDQIIVEGELSVYSQRGTYQIIVKSIDFEGVGELLIKLHKLTEELKALGWFNKEHKKPLPKFPTTIGVITSPTGSVIKDIINILSRRYSNFNLILNPVKVQGDGAAKEISKAIDDFNKMNLADVIIVGRGGGSLEDLMPFNEKCVALSIFNSKIPIISAVGHETDVSISDHVADIRAPTPSAAAELATQESDTIITSLIQGKKILTNLLMHVIKQHVLKFEKISSHKLFTDPYSLIGTFGQKLDDLKENLTKLLEAKIERAQLIIKMKKELMTSLNPKGILKKGYCIPFKENKGSVIISSKDLAPQDKILLLFHDGEVFAKIEGIKNE